MPSSVKGAILLSLRDLVRDLGLDGLDESEIEVRGDEAEWLSGTGDPYRGVSLIDLGESYANGTIGTQDVGYLVGFVLAEMRSMGAAMADDRLVSWAETIRRRLMDQRAIDSLNHPAGPREILVKILPGKTLTNPTRYPNYKIRQLVAACWQRESQSLSVT